VGKSPETMFSIHIRNPSFVLLPALETEVLPREVRVYTSDVSIY